MYDFKTIEKKWAKYWEDNQTFKTDVWDFSKPKFYALDMFPYPSGEGLHVGHPEGYTASDIVSRMKRMQGYNVLHPMGFDAFGLPAEQYAIKTGNHPSSFNEKNIKNFTRQLQMLGFSFDWTKTISTDDPNFYKWTQWIFKQLFLDGYARCQEMPVNWCEELGTVLANDEIINGRSERGNYPVVRKNMRQWVIDIPRFAERLLADLDKLDWPVSTKEMQKNWIGKSQGALISFIVADKNEKFDVFTTRADTLFGATYVVLAPEHEIVDRVVAPEKLEEVKKYKNECACKSELERTDLSKDKTGVFIGAYAINPVNNKKLPIYISDYVLSTYGTGAIMAVPAHDSRDYDFAKKFNLEIIPVIEGGDIESCAYEGDGIHINSDFLNGLDKEDAINKMIAWLEERKIGKKSINYRLREWIFARQRYWGEPVPIAYLKNGKIVALEDDKLPLVLPELENYRPTKSGESPLARATDWVNVEIDGVKGNLETSTMPGSAGSSWYFLRYIDPKNESAIADYSLLKHWLPVDLYIGGSEHAVGHLLYARCWTKYLFDKGLVPVDEPFRKLVHQGMILGENNEKMSKSRGNVVNPDNVVNDYGADALRLYEMFMGPIEQSKPWSDSGIGGAKRFIDRIWRIFVEEDLVKDQENKNLEKVYNETVKKVTEDYETLAFNTAISQMMIFINAVMKEEFLPLEYAEGFIKLLSPIAPFIAEEIWQKFGHNETISYEKWPTYDESKMVEDNFNLVVQVNGKLKKVITLSKSISREEIEEMLSNDETIVKALGSLTVKKIIYVPQKLINYVV